ncbi:DUF2924 domain-containing protein [Pendulispora brunnea]|uniref:DUF2924 domain-containing protein n=1 Tax=Pendulispora brunnea TaxID=2905690 RepID=A0ABZ2KAD2_9BACT
MAADVQARDVPARKVIESIQRQLDDLQTMTVAQLQVQYRVVFGHDATSRNKPHLIRKIGYRLQEKAGGSLSVRAKERIGELIGTVPIHHAVPSASRDGGSGRLPPGTLLQREHGGKVHQVQVGEFDFEYEGVRYASLSAVARKITGTHWNGRRFFNLTADKKKESA